MYLCFLTNGRTKSSADNVPQLRPYSRGQEPIERSHDSWDGRKPSVSASEKKRTQKILMPPFGLKLCSPRRSDAIHDGTKSIRRIRLLLRRAPILLTTMRMKRFIQAGGSGHVAVGHAGWQRAWAIGEPTMP